MKNLIYFIVGAVIVLSLNLQTAYAAFPVHARSERSISEKFEKRSLNECVSSAIERYHKSVPAIADYEEEGGKTLNIAAFGLGVAGAIALIAAFLAPTLLWVFGAIAVVASLAAIITGAHGMERGPLRGLGITGFVLGIVNLSAVVIVGIVSFLLLLALAIL